MSTTGRSNVRAGRTATEGHGSQTLTHRAGRARNALMCHAAARLGLPIPDSTDLAALPPDASLAEAVRQWRAKHGVADVDVASRTGGRLLLKAGWVSAIVLLGLAFSYGSVQ